MEIYIIRHGVAADLDNEVVEEGYRYLTLPGRNHCKIVSQKLKDMRIEFDQILSSPLIRAVQTAEIFATVLKYQGEIRTAIELIGGSSFTRFLQLLRRYSHNKRLAVFGHAPDVNNFTLNLIKANPVKDLQINFKNSGVCKVDFDFKKETGKFIWYLNPENMKLTEAN